jgi:ABC-2 type transport system ATP-binding protein
LDEADAYADRVVLIRQGLIVADGTAAEVKALASGRTVRATVADADETALRSLPGVEQVERHGNSVLLHCADSDAVARYLLTETDAKDLEITARALEDAFVALTSANTSATAQREDPDEVPR